MTAVETNNSGVWFSIVKIMSLMAFSGPSSSTLTAIMCNGLGPPALQPSDGEQIDAGIRRHRLQAGLQIGAGDALFAAGKEGIAGPPDAAGRLLCRARHVLEMGKLRRIVRNLFAPAGKVRHDRCKEEDDDKEYGGSIEGQERRPARQFQILNHGAARDLAVAARAPRSLNTMLKRSLRSFASGVIAEVRVAPENSGDWSMMRTRRAASAENPDTVTVPSAMRVSVRKV